MFILLSGRPPFDGRDDREIVKKVRIGHYNLNTPEWKYVSKEAQDLVKKLLTYDAQKRLTAQEAILHPWI